MGLEIKTNRHTLIPRPETELLVEAAIDWMRGDDLSRTFFWDVGTGSGAIAASLATASPASSGLATDVSATALRVAEDNFERLQLAHRIPTLKADLLDPTIYRILQDAARRADRLVIAANLPYLPEADRAAMMPDVVDFEPERALFAEENGLAVIRRFVGQLRRHLAEWGFRDAFLLVEYDPPQTPNIRTLLEGLGDLAREHRVGIHHDLAGRERFATLELRGIVPQTPKRQPPTTSSGTPKLRKIAGRSP
jgi:release factor glutamine methyltransferase